MFRVAVCDDEPLYLAKEKQAIESCLARYDTNCSVRCFSSGTEIVNSCSNGEYDLIMLDVEMPDLDGITVAKQLREKGIETPIAYVSAHMNYSTYGYHVNAVRFILKNEDIEVYICECIEHVLEMNHLNDRVVDIEFSLGKRQIKTSDILYLKSEGNYTEYILSSNNERLRKKTTIKKETANVAEYGDFVSISAKLSVNLQHITDYCRYSITLDNGEVLSVSQKKYNEVEAAIIMYRRGKCL